MDIYSKILQLREKNIRSALCIVVNTTGSTPRKTGSKMLVTEEGKIFGTVGGGSIELKIISNAIECIKENKTCTVRYLLDTDLEMHCGGEMDIYIEPVLQKEKLYIFGAGHIGKALSSLAVNLGFDMTVLDDRDFIFTEWTDFNVKKICGDYIQSIENLVFDDRTYIVIVTHNHEKDEDILAVCGKKKSAYIGMIGSSKKIELARKKFLENNILTKKELDRVNMPIGLDFKVETPMEIAVSILAKLIEVRHKNINK